MLIPSLLRATCSPQPPSGLPTTPILAAASPLIGAPSFLKLHVKVMHEGTVYDFVPLEPRSSSTLGALLRGGAVDAEIRVMSAPQSSQEKDRYRVVGHTALSAEAFRSRVLQRAAEPQRLSLLGNNCWSFAARLLESTMEPT